MDELPCARWGERFHAAVAPRGASWTPASEVFGDGLDAALAAQGPVPHPAVAASLLMERYAQRLVPPVVATWIEDSRVLDARWERVHLERHGARFARVGFPDAGEAVTGEPGSALLAERTFAGNVDRAVEALHAATRAGRRGLRGAVAHLVTTAFLALSWPRPDPSHHLDAARAFLERHDLAGLVHVDAREVAGRRWLYAERRTCCLAFRAAEHGGGYCATCPVTAATERQASFAAAAGGYAERTRASSPGPAG